MSKDVALWKANKTPIKWSEIFEILSIAQIQLNEEDMAWTIKVLVTLIISTAMSETFSLPPVNFLKDFTMKYQRYGNMGCLQAGDTKLERFICTKIKSLYKVYTIYPLSLLAVKNWASF